MTSSGLGSPHLAQIMVGKDELRKVIPDNNYPEANTPPHATRMREVRVRRIITPQTRQQGQLPR